MNKKIEITLAPNQPIIGRTMHNDFLSKFIREGGDKNHALITMHPHTHLKYIDWLKTTPGYGTLILDYTFCTIPINISWTAKPNVISIEDIDSAVKITYCQNDGKALDNDYLDND